MIMGAEIGMLIVETIAKIRRLFFVQGKPIKAICRELRLSRKVVRKVLRSKATEFRYEREEQALETRHARSSKSLHASSPMTSSCRPQRTVRSDCVASHSLTPLR